MLFFQKKIDKKYNVYMIFVFWLSVLCDIFLKKGVKNELLFNKNMPLFFLVLA